MAERDLIITVAARRSKTKGLRGNERGKGNIRGEYEVGKKVDLLPAAPMGTRTGKTKVDLRPKAGR